ncbi:hypothetical protein QP575_10540 [Alcaligenes faecalis subsp. phenolicus]|uniref:hypothetical protein n=1 Tax=Alcaligenes nematophilus TaxID=2994643 RepID=UPI002AA4B9CA|nr:hypothetical protein [Alcaligenes phenolicus]
MTEPINDGGPAYPFGQTDFETGRLVNGWGSEGMSLRDAFAIAALQGLLQRKDGFMIDQYGTALDAYNLADAMLRARNATQGDPDAS